MRSLLFVPADSPKKLDKGVSCGADALIVDLEDSVSPDRKAEARDTALSFLREIAKAQSRPRLLVRVNALDTGLTDDDLDAVVQGRPDAIMLPKAEGGALGQPSACQALRPRGDRRAAGWRNRHRRACDRDRIFPVHDRKLSRLEPAPGGSHLGRGGSIGRTRRRSQSRRERTLPRSLPPGAQPVPSRRRRGQAYLQSTPSMSISGMKRDCAEKRRKPAATASPPRWRSIRHRLRQSTRSSRRPRKQSRMHRAIVDAFARSPARASSASAARCTTARIWCERDSCCAGEARSALSAVREFATSARVLEAAGLFLEVSARSGSNAFPASRNSSVTSPVCPSGTAR